MTGPDPAENIVTPDGVTIPTGKAISTDTGSSSLLYNEYPFVMMLLMVLIVQKFWKISFATAKCRIRW